MRECNWDPSAGGSDWEGPIGACMGMGGGGVIVDPLPPSPPATSVTITHLAMVDGALHLTTRAERGKLEIIPARRVHAAFSAASESRGLKGPRQPSGLGSLFYFSREYGTGSHKSL